MRTFLATVSKCLLNDMATAERGTWSCGVRITKRLGRLQESSLPRMSNGGSAPAPQGSHFRYVPEMVVFHPARRSLQELCVKWDRHIQHDLNMARGKPLWKIRWITRALAILASPIVDSMKLLGSDRIRGVSTRLKAISVLFAIRAYRARKMLSSFERKQSGGVESGRRRLTTVNCFPGINGSPLICIFYN